MDENKIMLLFRKWCRKLRVVPNWDIHLEFVDDMNWRKTGDIKIDCDDMKAVLLINRANPKQDNMEEVLLHELLHLKMYPLDQVTESFINSSFEQGTSSYKFAYAQFFTALEQTVEELTKCYLLEFGEDKELSFGRCRSQKSFDDLYKDLKNLD